MVRRYSRAACRSRDLRRGIGDRGVALEPVLPVGHDAFTPGKTGGDDRQVVVGLRGLDRARLGDVLAADGPDEETVGSSLGNIALSRMVAVVWSMVLSTSSSVPVASACRLS